MKTLYELKKCTRIMKSKESIEQGCTIDRDDYDCIIIDSFDDKKEARLELDEYITEINELGNGYEITEYFIEEAIYDEDGDWIGGGDIWDFSPIVIEVVEKPTYKVVDTFDNMNDAIECLYNLEDGFLSFPFRKKSNALEDELKKKSRFFNMKQICDKANIPYQSYRNWKNGAQPLRKDRIEKLLETMKEVSK